MRFKKLMISLIFLILSLAMTLIIFYQAEKTKEVISIPVINKDLAAGSLIGPDDLMLIQVGGYHLPGNIVRKKTEVLHKYVKNKILKGSLLEKEDLAALGTVEILKGEAEYEIIALKVDPVKLAGGFPEKGDYLSATLIIRDENNNTKIIQPEVLKGIKVLGILDKEGNNISSDDSGEKGFIKGTDHSPALLIVDVHPIQQRLLLYGEYIGELHFALLPKIAGDSLKDILKEKRKIDELDILGI